MVRVEVVVVEEGVGEEGRLLEVAGLYRARSHVLEKLECVPRNVGPQVVAWEAGCESREEEQECQGAVPQAGL